MRKKRKPAIGQIWYCKFNLAYFLITEILEDKQKVGYAICKMKWTDNLEEDEVTEETLLTHQDFCYITG